MPRFTSIVLLSAMLLATVLAGCSETPAPTQTPSAKPVPDPTVTAAPVPTSTPAPASTATSTPAPEAPEPVGDDDHGDSFAGATAITVGESIEGAVDHDVDEDFFAFQAEEGVFYQVDVGLDTLDDSWLALLDSDESEVAFNDNFGDSLASRIVWAALDSGVYYVDVGGYGTGSYTLTVTILDVDDDHGNGIDVATAISVGEAVDAVLDYDADEDYFVFEAQGDVAYRVDVGLGTLDDSWLALFDSNEWELAYNDDFGDSPASRIFWTAPGSGEYYVKVGGYGTGSYTLTVSLPDVADDHGDGLSTATAISVGEAVEAVLDYDGDADYFVFEAQEDVKYRLNVELGTLGDSWMALYDIDEWERAYNDDHGDSQASRILWTAPDSGEYYIAVWGHGTGSYTLTITLP